MDAPHKPGLRTTEFWLAICVATMCSVAAVYSKYEWAQVAGTIGAALTAAGYGFSRASVKSGGAGQ